MATTYFPSKDAEFNLWVANFVTVANANLVALGLDAGDMTPIVNNQTTFDSKLTEVETKKASLAGSVSDKDAAKKSLISAIRLIVNQIQANPAVTTGLKSQLGISTREGGQYPASPVPPDQLIAELLPDGSIELDWNRNNNAPGTQFVIEAQIGTNQNFVMIDIVTRTSYIHRGITPGEKITYAVRARKNNETSAPSNKATVYGNPT